MIRRADTLGTFQIESRAQMAMLPRLKPRTFYDLVIQVAIVRPGPIQGDMVHPYLRRREGWSRSSYPTPELRAGAGQDARRAAVPGTGDAGGHRLRRDSRPTEADQLRRSMATFKANGGVHQFRDKLISGMVARGYTREFAEQTFSRSRGSAATVFPKATRHLSR